MNFLKKIGFVILWFAVVYAVVLITIWGFEEVFLYHPKARHGVEKVIAEKMPELKEVNYFLPNGTKLYGWYRAPQDGAKTFLVFHGNSYNTERHIMHAAELYKTNYGLFFPEYRGYGDIKGGISQETMQEDAATAYKYLKGRGVENKDIIIYGHSMGTYNTIYTAVTFGGNEPFYAVVLEAPFRSAAQTATEVFGHMFPVKHMMKNQYPSDTLIGKIKSPIFIGHGKKDKLIKFHQGWEMYNLANEPKAFFAADKADHNNMTSHGFLKAVLDWLKNPTAVK